jgi:Dyp-type peroxidase family
MSKLDPTDVQGFVLRGYTYPVARYLFLELFREGGREFLGGLIDRITTGEHWDDGKPDTTLNVAFTYRGLDVLGVPETSLQSFPDEFVQGMKARREILGDVGKNHPRNWEAMWHLEKVGAWVGIYANSMDGLESQCGELQSLMRKTHGAVELGRQDAGALMVDGKPGSKEHFGYSDGFGNPDYLGVERDTQPGQGKLNPDGTWAPLATGELLLGYADEAGELPVAPIPHLLANNGTFMVYRKLHQNVETFRKYLKENGRLYPGGEEKLASKFIGRWRDGTPVELSPDAEDKSIVGDENHPVDKKRVVNFKFGDDLDGTRCPIGAHVRRTNPRDAFGFKGKLINRRRITRRGLPYGPYVPEDQPVQDSGNHGIVFMVLNASLFRQFEFVQQQWIEYGNDAHQGNDKDMLIGNHGGEGKFVIQGTEDPSNPPFICGGLPNFVELRGGDYFFVPSMTALRLIATKSVDPR